MYKINLKILASFFEITLICTGVALASYLLLGQILEITGDSMVPLVYNKDHIMAEKISPKFSKLRRGEVVVFRHPKESEKLIIKRVVGLPNESIKILGGLVYINGIVLPEPYLKVGTITLDGEFLTEGVEQVIPEGEYVLIGDNRDQSIDSREWGFLEEKYLLGRAMFVYKPLQNFKFLLF